MEMTRFSAFNQRIDLNSFLKSVICFRLFNFTVEIVPSPASFHCDSLHWFSSPWILSAFSLQPLLYIDIKYDRFYQAEMAAGQTGRRSAKLRGMEGPEEQSCGQKRRQTRDKWVNNGSVGKAIIWGRNTLKGRGMGRGEWGGKESRDGQKVGRKEGTDIDED